MKKLFAISCLLAVTGAVVAQSVNLDDWLMKTDGTQYAWVTEKYQWGNGYLVADGVRQEWMSGGQAGSIAVNMDRHPDGDDLIETYTFTNTSKKTVCLGGIGIYTPFNDNYPDAATCMTNRCNVHIWAGDRYAYVNALRMSGQGPHLGLMVTEGSVSDYDIWERSREKGMSNYRGVMALSPPDMTLKPGKSYRLTWRIFSHTGDDFEEQLLKRGGMVVSSDRYVYELGQTAKVTFRSAKKSKTIQKKIDRTGEIRVDADGTYALLYGISSEQGLLERRIRFILDHQQMNDPDDPRYGALMIYDNEGDSILTDCQNRNDLDEGRERVGMGVLLAEYCCQHPNTRMQETLIRYAKFIREKLQEPDYTTNSCLTHKWHNRGYNYAWAADFYFRMALLTGNRQYALDGYGTLRALYRMFGYGFYCIDYPVTVGLKALKQVGLNSEHDFLLYDFKQTANVFLKNGLNFPKSEVNYEQSIIAPAVQLLCEVYLTTGEQKYLDGAKKMMPALEAFNGCQPNYRMNDISIRHWDGYWFGKKRTWGDVFPHYWSAVTAAAFHYYAKATGETTYQHRAENIVRNNLCLFFEDGRATCAFINPRQVNGEAAHYADAYANDQDWALMYYLLVNEEKQTIINGIPWYDQNNNPVNAHGAGILRDGGRYWLFGEYKSDTSNAFPGFGCYSSTDLVNWQFERVVLPVQPDGILGPNRVGERVKVMRCPKTGEYVLFAHADNLGYKDPHTAIATCKTVNGDYQLKGTLQYKGQPIKRWDIGVFQDEDGTGYLLAHHGPIYRLSDDYLSVDTMIANVKGMGESPAMFKKDGVYYLLTSNLTSWERNDNYYFTATNIAGPWKKQGLFCPEGTLTWNSQATFVLMLPDGTPMYMGDRWSYPHQASCATYVWLPMQVDGERLSIPTFWQAWNPQTVCPSDRLKAAKKRKTLTLRSNQPGKTVRLKFKGTHVALTGKTDCHGGYARVSVVDSKDQVVYSSLVDFYSKVEQDGIRVVTPKLPYGKYTLSVEVTGERSNWSDKRMNQYGTDDCRVQTDSVYVF